MSPLHALVAVFLVLLAVPAAAESGWGEAELRQYFTVANAYRPSAVALEERKLALADGGRFTLEERATRGKALREEGARTLDALLRKAGLSREVYEQLDARVRLLGSCLYMSSQESVTRASSGSYTSRDRPAFRSSASSVRAPSSRSAFPRVARSSRVSLPPSARASLRASNATAEGR